MINILIRLFSILFPHLIFWLFRRLLCRFSCRWWRSWNVAIVSFMAYESFWAIVTVSMA
ncbi:unnamed protein product [Meloidogyne enterolobii]|uniref:Uncharacterized protein n=1 Tax=Meloidogyne enterolobii TaxID=390850 RepID=A0ACB1ANM5_MELEN